MGPVLLLLFISSICYLFWMQRKQDERAFVIARQLCQQQQLQLLDCGRSGHSVRKVDGRLRFITVYQVDFSGDGDMNTDDSPGVLGGSSPSLVTTM